MRRRTLADLASAGTAVAVIAAVVAAAIDAASRGSLSGGSAPEDSLQPAFQAALAVGWAVPAIVLARRRRALPFWILAQLAAVTLAAAAILIAVGPDDRWVVLVASGLIVVELPALTAMVQLFPTGRVLVRWRPYLVVSVALGLLGVVAAAVDAVPEIDDAIGGVAGLVSVPLLAFTAIGGVVPPPCGTAARPVANGEPSPGCSSSWAPVSSCRRWWRRAVRRVWSPLSCLPWASWCS